MKWEANIVGYPISGWPKQVARPTTGSVPANPVAIQPNIMDLSDNIMLAHYQRERR
jgi:hypothetical protein